MSDEIPSEESLTVEFKSDLSKLPDGDLVLAVICLANTRGGTLYVGVEDDGAVTGLHASRRRNVDGLASFIANRTVPPLSVRVKAIEIGEHLVAAIEVPRSRRLVSTSGGTLQKRRLKANGQPECVPFLPHEFPAHQADQGLLDYSALPVPEATEADFDPLERERLRRAVKRNRGDAALLGLDDAEFDGALGLVRREGDRRVPTVAGLLLMGTEDALRVHLPVHEVAFQLLEGTEVRVNEFYRLPLVACFERVEEHFLAHLVEEEVQAGLFRVPVPRVDRRAFREAVVNSITHRDYTRLGAVHVRWQLEEHLTVSNPGGFVEGVTLQNLLVVEPRPRNPLLADALKRLGLAERTGRGVDLIYQGMLRYGRPAPNYGRSDDVGVVVELQARGADLEFLRLVLEQEERTGETLPVDALLALDCLRGEKRVDVGAVASAIQRDLPSARAVLERLVEAGIVQAHGVKKGRTYTLSAAVYRSMGDPSGYVRQAGFDPLQQAEMVKAYVREHGEIRRRDVVELCRVSTGQAKRLLSSLVQDGFLILVGAGRGAKYEPGEALVPKP
jgi:ATP-dependent DNA helicase RecG